MAWLTKEQEALVFLMSNISEEAYCAGWIDDLEFVLWHAVLHGPIRYRRALIDEQSVQQLKQLSEQAGSWILFDDETWETPTFSSRVEHIV